MPRRLPVLGLVVLGFVVLGFVVLLSAEPAAAEEMESITLSCFGGVTGGGRITSILDDGTIQRVDCTGPGGGRCGTAVTLGHDIAAFRHWAEALSKAHFEQVEGSGGFGEGSCSLATRQGRDSHSVAFKGMPNDPRGVPPGVGFVIRELGEWHGRR